VRSKSGQLVFNLDAFDFALTDDGIAQKLTLEQDKGSMRSSCVFLTTQTWK
jgi:hypothetical protein